MPTVNGKNSVKMQRKGERNDQEQVLVILGPTGSGKTGLAVDVAKALAKQRGADIAAEIISADSRAIYRGMDIGTAKPSEEEQGGVPHWGLDLVTPDKRFTVVDFKRYAEEKIAEIQGRGRLPILVGGTGLYIDALVFDYHFTSDVKKTCSDRKEMCADFVLVGLKWPRDELKMRLLQRSNNLFAQDIENETRALVERYGLKNAAMTADIYPIVWRMLSGELCREEAIVLNATKDWQLAKRQLTWFKRNKEIHWLEPELARDWILNYYSGN